MRSKIVKYHNDLNTVVMRKWTAEEMNFFFATIAKARDKGSKLIEFDTDEIKELIKFAQKDEKRWQETMRKCAKKVTQLIYYEDNGRIFEAMTLFSIFRVDFDRKKVEIEVSKNFEYVLNRLDVQFTQYELVDFVSIRSTYAKSAYRLFKQWRTIGRREFAIDEFKRLFDMPKYYQSCHIDRLVITPILKELPQYFPNLKVKKVKSNKRGNPVIAYEFTWKPEQTSGPYIEGKFDKKHKSKKKIDSTPIWSNPNYKNTTSKVEQEELEKCKRERLAKLREGEN